MSQTYKMLLGKTELAIKNGEDLEIWKQNAEVFLSRKRITLSEYNHVMDIIEEEELKRQEPLY